MLNLANLLGEKLLSRLEQEQWAKWFPWNDFYGLPDRSGRGFTLYCRSLVKHVTSDGHPFYYSSRKPTVTLRGKRRIVAFSPHAIQRIGERTVWSPTSYADLGDIFGFVHHCQYFEPTSLYPQQDAFALFQMCTRHHFSAEYARQIHKNLDPQAKYAYRVGYCPVVEDGDFFLAKTILVPGQIGTPEYGLLLKASFDKGVKEKMLERCNSLSYATTCATRDFSLRRWFHTHGVPQVITYTKSLFDYDTVTDHLSCNLVA
jgi:hypothetical protein